MVLGGDLATHAFNLWKRAIRTTEEVRRSLHMHWRLKLLGTIEGPLFDLRRSRFERINLSRSPRLLKLCRLKGTQSFRYIKPTAVIELLGQQGLHTVAPEVPVQRVDDSGGSLQPQLHQGLSQFLMVMPRSQASQRPEFLMYIAEERY